MLLNLAGLISCIATYSVRHVRRVGSVSRATLPLVETCTPCSVYHDWLTQGVLGVLHLIGSLGVPTQGVLSAYQACCVLVV